MRIATINSGSSSIKFSLYAMGPGETLMLSGNIAGIGSETGRVRVTAPDGTFRTEAEQKFRNHVEALNVVMAWLKDRTEGRAVDAFGHRVVHVVALHENGVKAGDGALSPLPHAGPLHEPRQGGEDAGRVPLGRGRLPDGQAHLAQRHGEAPQSLSALVPEVLPCVPVDYMDGRSLRYRRQPEGGFLLYSVGEDGEDDGGDASLPPGRTNLRMIWERKDMVWPAPATADEVEAYRKN